MWYWFYWSGDFLKVILMPLIENKNKNTQTRGYFKMTYEDFVKKKKQCFIVNFRKNNLSLFQSVIESSHGSEYTLIGCPTVSPPDYAYIHSFIHSSIPQTSLPWLSKRCPYFLQEYKNNTFPSRNLQD